MGEIYCHKKNMNIKENMRALASRKRRTGASCCGKIEKRIFEPSNGGIGTKLKTANIRLMKTISSIIDNAAGEKGKLNRKSNPKIRAIIMFTAGPAIATIASPHLRLRRL